MSKKVRAAGSSKFIHTDLPPRRSIVVVVVVVVVVVAVVLVVVVEVVVLVVVVVVYNKTKAETYDYRVLCTLYVQVCFATAYTYL